MKICAGARGRAADGFGHGMRGFERRNDAFRAAQRDGGIDGSLSQQAQYSARAAIVQPGVLGTDGGVIEPGRNGMGERDLAVVVLQQIAARAVQHAGRAAGEARGMFAQFVAAAAGFDADQLHAVVLDERMEDADGIAAAADAGDDRVGQTAFGFQNLARALRCRSRGGSRAPWSDTDARPAPSRAGNACRRRW